MVICALTVDEASGQVRRVRDGGSQSTVAELGAVVMHKLGRTRGGHTWVRSERVRGKLRWWMDLRAKVRWCDWWRGRRSRAEEPMWRVRGGGSQSAVAELGAMVMHKLGRTPDVRVRNGEKASTVRAF